METIVGKTLSDLALLVSEKWFAAVGLVGLIIFMWALLAETPHDSATVAGIGVILIGFGFGEGETRTFQQSIGEGFKITRPVRRMNGPSTALYTVAVAATVFVIARVVFW